MAAARMIADLDAAAARLRERIQPIRERSDPPVAGGSASSVQDPWWGGGDMRAATVDGARDAAGSLAGLVARVIFRR